MHAIHENDTPGPLVVMLHWLGGSANTWMEVVSGLTKFGLQCAAIDLPGFGVAAAAAAEEFSVEAMTEQVIASVSRIRGNAEFGPWVLAGHSMGGKVATIVARAAANGREGLSQLAGMVLISPSPPGPEPMDERKRNELLHTLGERSRDAQVNRKHAEQFLDANTGKLAINPSTYERSISDILATNPAAFNAWLSIGSKEDWSAKAGLLTMPALVLAGTEEAALGPDAQRIHTLPHFADARLTALEGCGHLAPLERPAEVVQRVADFFEAIGLLVQREQGLVSPQFRSLIDSGRTSPHTRNVLEERLHPAEKTAGSSLLGADELITLRAFTERVIPGCNFDLADRIEAMLTKKHHNGWRNDHLPPDVTAWRRGISSLNAAAIRDFEVPFVALDAQRQDALLIKARSGKLGPGLLETLRPGGPKQALDSIQMQLWFEDARAELAKLYIADPRTMERIGFTGFADEEGFTQIRLGEREEFEF